MTQDCAGQGHGTPIHPLRLVAELQPLLSSDVTLCSDMGSFHLWLARHLYSFKARQILISNGQQTLGVALPWAIAASIVRPSEKVMAISGDGGFLFSAARGYRSVVKPELDFGTGDDTGMFFTPNNHFFYLVNVPGQKLMLSKPASWNLSGVKFDGEFAPEDGGVGRPPKVTGNNVTSPNPGPDDWFDTLKLPRPRVRFVESDLSRQSDSG